MNTRKLVFLNSFNSKKHNFMRHAALDEIAAVGGISAG